MNRSRNLRSDVARNPPREGKLLEQFAQTVFVLGDARIKLAVSSFQVDVGDDPGAAMAGTGDIDHGQIVLPNHAIQMNVYEVQSRSRAPVAQQARLDMLGFERLFKQRIRQQVNLPDGKIIGGSPVGIERAELGLR